MTKRPTPDQARILERVLDERHAQDMKWGGPKHDDKHALFDWVSYIEHQLSYLAEPSVDEVSGEPLFNKDDARDLAYRRLIKVAALALAACEQLERQESVTATAELRELLAHREHEQWSDYMRYFLGKLESTFNGRVITPQYEKSLRSLIDTNYHALSEKQKDSDREEADIVLEMFREWTNRQGLGD